MALAGNVEGATEATVSIVPYPGYTNMEMVTLQRKARGRNAASPPEAQLGCVAVWRI
jgi:hypothetical protein